MSYKQHNSPFNKLITPNSTGNVYSSPERIRNTFGDEAATLGKKTLDFAKDMETALGTTSTEDLTNIDEEVANHATKGATANTGEISEWAQNEEIYGKMTAKSGALARKSNDESLPPRIRASAKRKLANQELKEKLQEERNFGDGGRNERHAEKLRIKEEKKLLKIKERNFNQREKINEKTDKHDGPINDPDSNRRHNAPFGMGMYEQQKNNMKQINSRGSAFPMVNPDMDDPTAIPPNRAGRADNTTLTQGTSITDPGLQPQSQAAAAQMMGDIASSVGVENQSMNPMAPGQDNTQDQIAQAQENLGTDAATNTPPNTMGGAGMGMFGQTNPGQSKGGELEKLISDIASSGGNTNQPNTGIQHPAVKVKNQFKGPSKKDWIQDVNKDIEKRGTKGVCTGSKFGSDSCPPGSKRYNLAETFKKMNK